MESRKTIIWGMVVVLLILVIPQLIVYIKDNKKQQQLENSKYSWGIIADKYKVAPELINYIKINHYVDHKKITSESFRIKKCASIINIGDTVLIKYSKTNPKTVEIESCHWNDETKEKLRKLRD